MTKKEYEILEDNRWKLITVDDLKDKSDRTLIYGFTFNRDSYHTYIKDGRIHTVRYHGYGREGLVEIDVKDNRDYYPKKRLYPECCDFEFCSLLYSKLEEPCFTTFNEGRRFERYYGRTL